MTMCLYDDDEWFQVGWLCCPLRSGERVITLKLLPTTTTTQCAVVHLATVQWSSRHNSGPKGQACSPPWNMWCSLMRLTSHCALCGVLGGCWGQVEVSHVLFTHRGILYIKLFSPLKIIIIMLILVTNSNNTHRGIPYIKLFILRTIVIISIMGSHTSIFFLGIFVIMIRVTWQRVPFTHHGIPLHI